MLIVNIIGKYTHTYLVQEAVLGQPPPKSPKERRPRAGPLNDGPDGRWMFTLSDIHKTSDKIFLLSITLCSRVVVF